MVWWVVQEHQSKSDPTRFDLHAVHRFRTREAATARFLWTQAQFGQASQDRVRYPVNSLWHDVRARPFPPSAAIRAATGPWRLLVHESGGVEVHQFPAAPAEGELAAVLEALQEAARAEA